jgi:hypothetical protein
VVFEREVEQCPRAPSARSSLQLVEPIPSVSRDEWQNVLEARPTKGTARSPNASPGNEPRTPNAVYDLKGRTARNSQAFILFKSTAQPIEEIGFERHVGIDVDQDIRLWVESVDPRVECVNNRRSALGLTVSLNRDGHRPWKCPRKLLRDLASSISRGVFDDDPLDRGQTLSANRFSEKRQRLRLVVSRRHDRIREAASLHIFVAHAGECSPRAWIVGGDLAKATR